MHHDMHVRFRCVADAPYLSMMANRGDSTWKTWAPAAVAIGLVMFVAPLLIRFPLLDPDEGLHAGIAQEMVERGDWITPSFLSQPFLDKPILYFWAEAISLELFGFNEAALRLPGLMFGLLGAITTGLLAWRLLGASAGWIAGILYATTILPTALAQAASHDVALIPWINLALLLLWESQRGENRRGKGGYSLLPEGCRAQKGTVPFSARYSWLCIFGAGFFVGLLILTKGLSGVAVVGIAYGGYRLITRRISFKLVLQGIAVLAVAALVASPWYAALEIRNPGYLHYYFIDRHLLGVATDSQPHGNQPWWYYLPLLIGGGLPWIGYLPTLLRKNKIQKNSEYREVSSQRLEAGGRRLEDSDVAAARSPLSPLPSPLLWCWLIGWIVFLTLAQSKLATYLWPAFPAVTILAAMAWKRLIDGTLGEAARRDFTRTFVWSSWSGPIVLPIAVYVVQLLLKTQFSWPVWAVTAVVAAAAPLPLIPWHKGRYEASLRAAAFSMAAQFTVVMTLILPQAAEQYTALDLARHFNRQGTMPGRLFVVEERIGSLVFYLTPELRAGLSPERLSRFLLDEPVELLPGDVLAVPENKLRKATDALGLENAPSEPAGRYRIFTVGRAPNT